MSWKKQSQTWRRHWLAGGVPDSESSVSVNARLARLPSSDLADLAESSLGQAGRELTHSRYTGKDMGQERFYLELSLAAAKQALEAIQVLVSRVDPS